MDHLLYLFHSEESATVMNAAVARVSSAVSELTDELAREIYISIAKRNGDEVDPIAISDWTADQVAIEMWGKYTYLFDRVAVVPAEHESAIEQFGDEVSEDAGDDSDCYEAAASFGDFLVSLSVCELTFPDGSQDEE